MSGLTTSSKVGFAITSSLGAILLSAVSYDPAVMVFIIVMGLVVVKMEKKIPQMQAELAAREN